MLESEAHKLLVNALAHYVSTFAQHFESLEKRFSRTYSFDRILSGALEAHDVFNG